MTITIHVVMHAHLDPIWMWPWTSGLDEAMATARSACDRLDAHPDLFYTQGEAWTFHLIEKSDPALFKRVAAHVANGRWEIVNGWWTQPDCNVPSALGLQRQIEVGLKYVKSRFGLAPRCGFNPDSFGHCAHLPEILRDCGQDRYVYMRPQQHERWMPKHLFRWRARPGGREITAYRLNSGYNNSGWLDGFRHELGDLPDGCQHTMALAGLGDHGGGPTEKAIAWVRANADAIPGAKLVFSTVDRFFTAVARQQLALPEVVGELQMHAVGCYTVVRAVKTGVRRAEEALAQAETVAQPDDAPRLDEAWRQVAAHQFHDTLGGTCLPSAYVHVVNQLGAAAATAEEILQFGIRRRMGTLPDDHRPRVVLFNSSGTPFSGWCEIEPYLEAGWTGVWRLVDERGAEVPFQELEAEAGTAKGWWWNKRRCLLRIDIPVDGMRVLHLDRSAKPISPTRVTALGDAIASDSGIGLRAGSGGVQLTRGGATVASVSLSLVHDPSDTWSHGIDRYGEGGDAPVWSAAQLLEAGPQMAALMMTGRIGESRLRAEWRVHAGDPAVELILDIDWAERYRILKLVLPLAGGARRVDGTPGMALARENDGAERPLTGWTALPGLGVVCPEVYALDCTPRRARLTMLRAAVMACHDPNPGSPARAAWSDQGPHRFRFRFFPGEIAPAELAAQATAWLRPPAVAELTRGMGPWDS